ncbi:MAG: hypothetical protein WCC57_17450 [Paracoccaceae bacterium]
MAFANTVGSSINASVENNFRLRDKNPTLIALATDPLQVLLDHGLPADFFANTPAAVMEQTIAYWKQQATNDLAITHGGQPKRGFFRCWACRIGFAAIIAVLGVVVTAASAGAAGPLYAGAIAWVTTFSASMTLAAATTVVSGALAVGSTVLAGGLGALIEFICEQIPDTCG